MFFIFGPLLMLTEVAGEIVLPKIMSSMINIGIENGDTAYIISRALLMFGAILVMIVGGIGGHYLSIKAAISFSAALRKDVFARVQRFSFRNIDRFSTGSLVTRLTNDITQLEHTVRMALIMLMRSPGLMVGGLIMAYSINKELMKILLIVMPILAISIITLMRTAFPRFGEMQNKIDDLNSATQENITNVRVVKSFVREKFEIKKFKKANEGLADATLRAMNIIIWNMPVMTLAMNITTIVIVWKGGNFVIGESMGVGDLSAFTTYITQILMSLMMLSMIVMQASRATASSKRIKEVLNEKIDLTDEDAKEPQKQVEEGSIEFKNVSFKYYAKREKNILSDLNFKIDAGTTVGIVGSTGSGKSSLVQLIPRLYDVLEGEVLVDGVNVRDYSLKNLRNNVAMVLQKNILFSGTIKENLKWGNENATDEEIEEFASYAQAHKFISDFTEGYDMQLGQGGVNVSGGQKQRLCIARALLKKPKILILDDSTSAVDTATEARIREAFATTLKSTTKIIIAQRISSVMDADKILVLDNGMIVGEGTHDELLQSCEEYQEIYYSQNN